MNNRKPTGRPGSFSKKGNSSFAKKKDSSERGERPSYSDRPKKSFTKREEGSSSERPKRSFSRDTEGATDKPKRAYTDRADRKRTFVKKERSSSERPRRSFNNETEKSFEKPRRASSDRSEGRSYSDKPKRSFDKDNADKPKRAYTGREDSKRGYVKRDESSTYDKPKRSFDTENKSFDKPKRDFADRPKRAAKEEENLTEGQKKRKARSFSTNKENRSTLKSVDKSERPTGGFRDREERMYGDKPKKVFADNKEKRADRKENADRKYKKDYTKKKEVVKATNADKGLTRLNKYIANAGICSRREADDLIASGCVTVNDKIITELGYTVKKDDVVNYSGARIKAEKNVYLLLNKPKDYITTADDERGRRTVMELVANACKERIYPVGRLDRQTMGLLMFTNDGEMTKKLTHPKNEIKKLYHVELDKNLKQTDFETLKSGIELEDGFMKPDELSYVGETKREVGIEIHSGKNRVVRRLFEHLGYDVLKLDRVMFAGLTKKDLPRGRHRFLTDKEIAFLKMMK